MIHRETDRLEHLRDEFPAVWFRIKDELPNVPCAYMSYKDYRQFCATHGEPDGQGQDTLIAFLHQLGIVLNFKDDPRLQDTNVIQPGWATNGVYSLLYHDELRAAGGHFRLGDLSKYLPSEEYPREIHSYLIELMRKFELCFEYAEDRDAYLIPELLGKETPEWRQDFPPEACLNFEYHYNILPEGLIPRFIVRTHRLSEGQERWRHGVVLKFEGNTALVRADIQDRKVFISVAGPESRRRSLLAIIRSHFEVIHHSISRLQADAKVSVPGRPHVVLHYADLVAFEEQGVDVIHAVDKGEVLSLAVTRLLNAIETPSERRRAPTGNEKSVTIHAASGAHLHFEGDRMESAGRDYSKVEIHDSTLNQSPVAIKQELNHSYKLAESSRDDELKKLLSQLLDETADALALIEDQKARTNIKDDTETFVKEASKEEPRRRTLEMTRDGLIEAAKTVGKIATPILTVVDKILAHLP